MSVRRSSGRAATEPLAALVALFAVGVGLTAFAGALPEADGAGGIDPETALQEVRSAATSDGVLSPAALSRDAVLPAGWRLNVTLETPERRHRRGPQPERSAETASRPVTVLTASGERRPGRLTVAVWR